MAINIPRLRLWFAVAAIAVAVVVAGSYFYARLRVRRAIADVPRKLGVNIQQSTQGFTFSKSEGGRTLFTVHASKAVQYKQGGRAELRDVNIIVYGRLANRFDQIYGADFEYDPQAGEITARGDVHIYLEGNTEGPISPDQAPPQELKNPIHLKTSGLVFHQKTGVAETAERIEFRVPQASGSATGAIYDSRAATLTLSKDIRVHTTEPHEADISARHAVVSKGPNRAILDGARMKTSTGDFSTRQLTFFFHDDNTVEHVVASGEVRAHEGGRTTLEASSERASAWLNERNQLRSSTLSGNVELTAAGADNVHASAGTVTAAFSPRNQVQKVTAGDNVRVLQQPPSGKGHPVEIAAPSMNFLVENGRVVSKAVTSGASQIVILPAENASGEAGQETVATAGKFEADFQGNRLRSVTGYPSARLLTTSPGRPDRITTSDRVEVRFAPTGGLANLVQDGDFHYIEEAPGGRREAFGGKATFNSTTNALVITGSPRVIDGGMTTTAETIGLDRRTGDASARGDVKTTYSDLRPQPGGALLAAADPIHVTARDMVMKRSTGTARYLGARLWQAANVLEAPILDFQREPRRLEARGENGSGITTVFLEQDKSGKVTPVNVTAAKLVYTDSERRARFEGGVTVRGADTTVTAAQVDVFLKARGQGAATASGPSQVEKIVARNSVVIQQPKRRATGQLLVYNALEASFVLTGGPPSIFDAERGRITGDSLTFFQRDDRVLVESRTSPTVTQTRVAK